MAHGSIRDTSFCEPHSGAVWRLWGAQAHEFTVCRPWPRRRGEPLWAAAGFSGEVQKLDCSPGPGLLQPLHAVCPPTEERTDSGWGWGSERRGWMLSRQHHPRPTRKHPLGEGNTQESRDLESGHFSATNLGQVTLGLRFLMHQMWDWGSMLSRDLHSFIQQIFIQSLPLAWHCPTLEDIIIKKNNEHLCSTLPARCCSKNFIYINPFNLQNSSMR